MGLPHEISQRDLRIRSGEIMAAVEGGEVFTVTSNGRAIAQLIPLRRRRTVTREQFAAGSRNAPVVDVDRFRADIRDALADDLSDPYAD